MRLINNLLRVIFAVVRLATTASDVASRLLAAVSRQGGIFKVTGKMNDRQLQDVGLPLTRMHALNDNFKSAEAQLGMVR